MLLILAALLPGTQVSAAARPIAGGFLTVAGLDHPVVPDVPDPHGFAPWVSVAVAVIVAGLELSRAGTPSALRRIADLVSAPFALGVSKLHTGLVSDYVARIAVGLAVMTIGFTLGS